MSGTITDVLTPSNILVGKEKVNLENVDSSNLNSAAYAYLTQDLKGWLIGKEVFVKGNRVYFDLNGAYNSVSINEMIQKLQICGTSNVTIDAIIVGYADPKSIFF
jgi:hypothetical protein